METSQNSSTFDVVLKYAERQSDVPFGGCFTWNSTSVEIYITKETSFAYCKHLLAHEIAHALMLFDGHKLVEVWSLRLEELVDLIGAYATRITPIVDSILADLYGSAVSPIIDRSGEEFPRHYAISTNVQVLCYSPNNEISSYQRVPVPTNNFSEHEKLLPLLNVSPIFPNIHFPRSLNGVYHNTSQKGDVYEAVYNTSDFDIVICVWVVDDENGIHFRSNNNSSDIEFYSFKRSELSNWKNNGWIYPPNAIYSFASNQVEFLTNVLIGRSVDIKQI